MMRIIGAEEMREIDRRACADLGVPSLSLMENAGKAVALAAWSLLQSFTNPEGTTQTSPALECLDDVGREPSLDQTDFRVVVVCGTGNNGGDGFVAARHLANWGIDCTTLVAGAVGKIQGDALVNYEALRKRGLPVASIEGLNQLALLAEADLIIDGLLGTGMRGDLMELARDVVAAMNSSDAPVLSIDIPSGIHTDTGAILGDAVRANVTVTFATPKPAHVLHPGSEYSGSVVVADIGVPAPLIHTCSTRGQFIITPDHIASVIPVRPRDSHKGVYGHAGILAGSTGMVGAARMAAHACSSAGAGLTTVAIPSSQYIAVATGLTECMTLPIGENADFFKVSMVEQAMEAVSQWDALAIGCGLGQQETTNEFVRQLLRRITIPAVVDADGLNALGQDAARILQGNTGQTILTPHPGEMARLLGTDASWVQSNRIEAATGAADDFGTICVLKGANTIVAEPHGHLFFNLTGNVGLAKGGSGDTLTGIIVSLLAQGLEPIDAACAGVWMHGKCADFVAEHKAEATILASDCVERLSDVYHLLESLR